MSDDPNNPNPPPPEEAEVPDVPIPEVPDFTPTDFSAQMFKDIESGVTGALAEAGLMAQGGGGGPPPGVGPGGVPIAESRTMAEIGHPQDKPIEVKGMEELLVEVRRIRIAAEAIQSWQVTQGANG